MYIGSLFRVDVPVPEIHLLSIKHWNYTFPETPTEVCERIYDIVIVRLFYLCLIQYDKQIPITVFTIVSPCPGTIKQQPRILRKHVLRHLLNALNNFILAYNIDNFPQRYELFSIPPNFSRIICNYLASLSTILSSRASHVTWISGRNHNDIKISQTAKQFGRFINFH